MCSAINTSYTNRVAKRGDNMTNAYLQAFRKSKSLSTGDLASKIGVSKSLNEKVEYGARNPSFGFTRKLKTAFPDIDIDKLFQTAEA